MDSADGVREEQQLEVVLPASTPAAEVVTENSTEATMQADGETVSRNSDGPSSRNATLLREWNNNNNAPMSPPVAPAVVLNDGETTPQRTSKIYQYPVATFVSNLVRNAVDHVGNHIYASVVTDEGEAATTTATQPDSSEQATLPLSIRSEADAQLLRGIAMEYEATAAAATAAAAAAAAPTATMSGEFATTETDSVRTVMSEGWLEDMEGQEFVLIDGDLIALPAHTPQNGEESDGVDDVPFQFPFQRGNHRRGCHHQPGHTPLRRVKGIRKWIKKRARRYKKNFNSSHQHLAEQFDGRCAEEASAAAIGSSGPNSAATSVSPKRKDKKAKKRRSWRRSDSQSDDERQVPCQQQEVMAPIDEHIPEDLLNTGSSPVRGKSVQASFIGNADQMFQADVAEVAGVAGVDAIDDRIPDEASNSDASSLTRSGSVQASFIGNADQMLEAGVLVTDCAVASAVVEMEMDDKKDDALVPSLVPPDADFKVDKADAPDVESMLRRAALESANDLEQSIPDYALHPLGDAASSRRAPLSRQGKSDGSSCPLSLATSEEDLVHNDILKVVMVGSASGPKSSLARAIRHSNKKPKRRATLGVDVHSWTPEIPNRTQVKFTIWDVQGASRDDGAANFGARPGTQSLFFSARSLYLLVWDLAAESVRTQRRKELFSQRSISDDDDQDEDEDEDETEEENEYLLEEAKRQSDLSLQADIENTVLSWVDCIAHRGPGSAILPVAIIPDEMDSSEVKRRCDLMQGMLVRHIERFQGAVESAVESAPKLLLGAENDIMCVNLSSKMGINRLQETMMAIAVPDESSGLCVFDHLGVPVPPGTVEILETVRRLKDDHKLVLVDHLMTELGGAVMNMKAVAEALRFLSSIGEVFYFGTPDDEILSRYIILSRKWFVSALSCILRNDLKRELAETRRFMNMQCIYSDQQFPEHEVTKALVTGSDSNCPLLSATDTNMLWQSMSFMREAADRSTELSESSTTASTMFDFLVRLMVQSGVFLPLGVSRSIDDSEVYFVPSLLSRVDPVDFDDLWTYKSSDSWKTTLCHSWLFRDGAPSNLMEQITASLLRDLFEFAKKFHSANQSSPERAQTYPLSRSSVSNFMERHDGSAMGRIRIHQVMCWKAAVLVKIGCVFADSKSGELTESFVEIFVSIQDGNSNYCVASDAMRPSMQRLVVSGKGQVGFHGRKLWKGGYAVVLDSITSSLASFSNVDRQVVCPECLAHSSPRLASTWGWDSVRAAASSGVTEVRCIRGHRVDANLICGTHSKRQDRPTLMHEPSVRVSKPVQKMLGSVVVVGLLDSESKEICNVGSGFVVDRKLGLIVTAGHILFNMESGRRFGTPYHGIRNAKIVVGVIPHGQEEHSDAVFRYFAELVVDDIHNVDACVIRLTTRFEKDIDEAVNCGDFPEVPLDISSMQRENLSPLKMTSRFELEESVRILGFNQGGEGVLTKGKHVNLSADFAKGYICKKFRASVHNSDDSSFSSSSSSKSGFAPREEIVIMCPTISGHSGGPCVNNEGKVIGILSRADPVDRQRCYLVPSSQLKDLVKSAKKQLSRPLLFQSNKSTVNMS